MGEVKYFFLCEFSNKQIFVYAIKSSATDWHYFEEKDSVIKEHFSLPPDLKSRIFLLDKLLEVRVDLDCDQLENYLTDGKFVFKGKELRTYIQLAGKEIDQHISTRKKESKSTDDLVFAVGKSNPAVFLNEFEKCGDAKTEKDKLFKIRNFVKSEDRRVFSEYFLNNDWSTAKSTFLKKYSLAFTINKKAELDFPFNEENGLRSFVLRKMKALSTYTSLSVQNQLEIILNELPVEVSNLFIVHDKIHCTKADILDFCDTLEDYLEEECDKPDKNVTITANPIEQSQLVVQDLEVFENYTETVSETESSELETSETSDLDTAAGSRKNANKNSAKRSRGEGLRGRPRKYMKIVCNDDDQSTTSTGSYF